MGGLGGGGIVLPICLLFFKFDPKNSIALSNFSIFLASVLIYFLNSGKAHPLKKGKGIIVDMNLAIIMLPMIISGVQVGVIFNILLPNVVILVFYDILLVYVFYNLVKKIRAIQAKEAAVSATVVKVAPSDKIELATLGKVTHNEKEEAAEEAKP